MAKQITGKLKLWRREHGLSQAAAALRVGVARRTWHLWETGEAIPSEDAMRRLFDLTGEAFEPNDFYDVSGWRALLRAAVATLRRAS